MDIAIFGTGEFYNSHYRLIRPSDSIVACVDNNSKKWGRNCNGIIIGPPSDLLCLKYDLILLMVNAKNASCIRKQLVAAGIPDEMILFWAEYWLEEKRDISLLKGDILFVSPHLNYVGGVIAEIYASQVLMDAGKSVTIVAGDGNRNFLNEYRAKGYDIRIIPYIEYICEDEIEWIDRYNHVIVNVFQLYNCTKIISDHRKLLWWLHEPSEFYKNLSSEQIEVIRSINYDNVKIVAVSEIARNNFVKYLGVNKEIGIMQYGIPDLGTFSRIPDGILNIAIIGTVYSTKGQDLLLDAIDTLTESEKRSLHLWVIGDVIEDDFGRNIKIRASESNHITITGQLNREETEDIEKKMDVIVSASREDCLPIVIAEGLMLGKTCVVSSKTGFFNYMHNYENGLIFESENTSMLADCIRWLLKNKDVLSTIGYRGRELYDEFFSMRIFQNNLLREMSEENDQ